MEFTIKSKYHLDDFIKMLKYYNHDPQKINETELTITIEGEERYANFELCVAVFVSKNLFSKTVTEMLQSMMVEELAKERFLEQAIHSYVESTYWKSLTLVLVADYFRNSKSLNLDSFTLFNMNGFKKEVQEFIENATKSDDDEEYSDVDNDFEDFDFDLESQGIQDLMATLRKTLSESKVDLTQYEIVHLEEKNDSIVCTTNTGLVMDNHHFSEVFNKIHLIIEEDESESWQNELKFFFIIFMIFPIKKIIVHYNVLEEAKETLLSVESSFPPSLNLIFEYCNGCDRCDE